jgi:hypothetical protein
MKERFLKAFFARVDPVLGLIADGLSKLNRRLK